MYIIVLSKISPNDVSQHSDILEHLNLDFSDLLQLTFTAWNEIENCDYNGVCSIVQGELSERYFHNYGEFISAITVVSNIVYEIHERFSGQLSTILRETTWDTKVKVVNFLNDDLLLKLETDVHEPH